jgi:hypothetical protein
MARDMWSGERVIVYMCGRRGGRGRVRIYMLVASRVDAG